MRMAFFSLARALGIALVIITSISANAEDKAAARAAFRAATQHFNLGEYQDALAGFKTAYRNFEDPSFLFNIAQCERLLGHKQEAIRAYRTYLTNSPEAANGPEVRTLISKLEDELRARVGDRQEPSARDAQPAAACSSDPTRRRACTKSRRARNGDASPIYSQ